MLPKTDKQTAYFLRLHCIVLIFSSTTVAQDPPDDIVGAFSQSLTSLLTVLNNHGYLALSISRGATSSYSLANIWSQLQEVVCWTMVVFSLIVQLIGLLKHFLCTETVDTEVKQPAASQKVNNVLFLFNKT